MLRFYIEVARSAFRRQLIYRWANIAGLLTNIFFGVVFSYVLLALFQSRPSAAGYSVRDTLRYIWLVQSLTMTVLTFGWYDLMLTIRTGAVMADLSKPCDFYWYWFSREFGRSIYYLLYRGIPTYLAGALLFGLGLPGDLSAWSIFLVSLVLGTIIGFSYRFLSNVVAFWFLEARSIGVLATVVALFFTGGYVPLIFLPPWLLAIANWLPFNGLMNVPTEIVLGKISLNSILFEVSRQVLWVIIMIVGVRSVSLLAMRKVIVQGG